MAIHLIGEQFGDYRLIRLIGRGGFADVYLGEHRRRKTLVAVKVLNTRLANKNVKSFLNEARSIRLRHSNIAQISGVDRLSGNSTVTSQPIVPTKTGIPSLKPTATQGLGGS